MRRSLFVVLAVVATWLVWQTDHQLLHAPVTAVSVITGYWTLLDWVPKGFWQRHDWLRSRLSSFFETLALWVVIGPLGIFYVIAELVVIIVAIATTNAYWLMAHWIVTGVVLGTAVLTDAEEELRTETRLQLETLTR